VSVVVKELDTFFDTEEPPARVAPVEFPPRSSSSEWAATCQSPEELFAQLTSSPFVLEQVAQQTKRARGVQLLIDWLADQPGRNWQERWHASGADNARSAWRSVQATWLGANGLESQLHRMALAQALPVAISADVFRPSITWLAGSGLAKGGRFVRSLAVRDPEGFDRLGAACDANPAVSQGAKDQVLHRAALIIAAKGGTLGDITVGDVVELLDVQAELRGTAVAGRFLFYRLLADMGVFGPDAPTTLQALHTLGQRSPEELIDRYHLVCRPVRDLLVAYLKERQPALDYSSLETLGWSLGKLFWADLEEHHPGIDTLHLGSEIASAWKLRLRTVTKTVTNEGGEKAKVTVERINYRECLTPVRAFYLDLAHWAVEDPGRWAHWVTPCPIGEEEINRKKAKRHRKSRMDARTRERLPVLPVVVRSVAERRTATAELLDAARRSLPGDTFSAAGTTLVRTIMKQSTRPGMVWAHDPNSDHRRDLVREEDSAFWAWAIVEVLRATGIRAEELLELSHHALVQYRLPTTGEVIPLLQIVPSKTDTERLLVVSPDLADVLGAIILRVSHGSGTVPLVPFYDEHERVWRAPAPLLFQRYIGSENRAMTPSSARLFISSALARTGLLDQASGMPLHYTPHDFRRMMITDAIMNGLPPHIAQVIAGHQDINVTLGYKAVYPEEAIQAHLAFLARRRSLRPSDEYRTPTDEEWQEFLGHFERRKVSIGTCARAFSTPCIHEHACVRCPMLWPDPGHRPRLVEIRANLTARIAEAEREGWFGEIEGLQVSLAGAEEKLGQMEHRRHLPVAVHFGAPAATVTTSEPLVADHG